MKKHTIKFLFCLNTRTEIQILNEPFIRTVLIFRWLSAIIAHGLISIIVTYKNIVEIRGGNSGSSAFCIKNLHQNQLILQTPFHLTFPVRYDFKCPKEVNLSWKNIKLFHWLISIIVTYKKLEGVIREVRHFKAFFFCK